MSRMEKTARPAAEANATPAGSGNLGVWDRLKRTDPRATKGFTRAGGFRGTQIDPAWRLQRMTEEFGPVGRGWGYEQLEWTVVERMVFACVRVWYRDPDTGEVCWTGPQWGGTEIVRRRRDGTEAPDDECFKMSVTDALGKCLLQLGLAADVHMGLFDDSKYREEAEAFYHAKEDPELRPEAVRAFEEETRAAVEACATLDALDALWRGGVSARARAVGAADKAAQARVVQMFSQRKADLLKRPPAAA